MQNSMVHTAMGTMELTIDDAGNGVIDQVARRVYTMGQCHALAAAIKERTGWTVKGLGGISESPDHCVAWCPKLRRYVDIDGLSTLGTLKKRHWYIHDKGVTNPDMSKAMLMAPPDDYLPPSMPEARAFAKTVLAGVNTALKAKGYAEVPI